ncbi:hypothetical protein [Leuconostoc lactis]|uniref:hypothetical protein n=1 Tax=Leuconostoc lactis TaxID=1246 RepID=UPI0006DCF86C|nr:hypothetical protein [Leuconostoc lactis]KQB80217.1 hypothetical protein AN225_08370 [Leuconostoc lactis]
MSKVKHFFHGLADRWRRNWDIYFDFVMITVFNFFSYFITSFTMVFFVITYYQARSEQGLKQPMLPYHLFDQAVMSSFAFSECLMIILFALWLFFLPSRFNRFVARRELGRTVNVPITGCNH